MALAAVEIAPQAHGHYHAPTKNEADQKITSQKRGYCSKHPDVRIESGWLCCRKFTTCPRCEDLHRAEIGNDARKANQKLEQKPEPKSEPKPDPKPEPKPEPKPDPKPEPKPEAEPNVESKPPPESKSEANKRHDFASHREYDFSQLKRTKKFALGYFSQTFLTVVNNERAICKVTRKGREGTADIFDELKVFKLVPRHENVMFLLGYCLDFEYGDIAVQCLIYPYMAGGSIRERIDKLQEPLSPMVFIILASGMVAALSHLHRSNIIHRDMALRNVFLRNASPYLDEVDLRADDIVLGDLGSAKVLRKKETHKATDPLPWRWIASETMKSGITSKRSDIFSLGVAFWEILAGPISILPFPAVNTSKDKYRILHLAGRGGDSPLYFPKYVPSELKDLLIPMYSDKPNVRPSLRRITNSLDMFREQWSKLDDWPTEYDANLPFGTAEDHAHLATRYGIESDPEELAKFEKRLVEVNDMKRQQAKDKSTVYERIRNEREMAELDKQLSEWDMKMSEWGMKMQEREDVGILEDTGSYDDS